jgi:hypothetical protein
VSFSADGSTLYSGSDDHTVLEWRTDLEAIRETYCIKSRADRSDSKTWDRLVPGLDFKTHHLSMCPATNDNTSN